MEHEKQVSGKTLEEFVEGILPPIAKEHKIYPKCPKCGAENEETVGYCSMPVCEPIIISIKCRRCGHIFYTDCCGHIIKESK